MDAPREIYHAILPDVLNATHIFNVDITVGSTHAGIHLDSVRTAAEIIREVAVNDIDYTRKHAPDPHNAETWVWPDPDQKAQFARTKASILRAHPEAIIYPFWSNLARLAVFVNAPQENPFMAGGFAGPSTPERTISVGINGAGVLQQAILTANSDSMADIIQSVKLYSSLMYKVAEAVRFQVLKGMNERGIEVKEAAGVVDLSIATTDDRDPDGNPTNSMATALNALGLTAGAHGTLAGLGLLTDIVKKAGNASVAYAGGLSGTFIPVSEDAGMADAVARSYLTFPRYLSMTSVCAVGVDMVPVWWPVDRIREADFEHCVAGILLDEAAIGLYTNKTTSTRILPVHYKPHQDLWVVFMGSTGLLGASRVMDLELENLPPPTKFVTKRGALPAPLISFTN